MTGQDDSLPAVDAAALTPLVRIACRRDDLEVRDWRHEPFGHSLDEVYGTARSIFRYSGTAAAGGAALDWSLVLKVVPASEGDREALAYRSGFLDTITGVRAPRCFGVVDRPGGGHWLWLEHVVDRVGRDWPRERYLLAARHLGEFNGGIRSDAMSLPWLGRSPLADAVAEFAPGLRRVREARENPFVADAISQADADALLALVGNVDAWLITLDRLPQTICHWDAHRANLVSSLTPAGAVETVVLDWAGTGWGPFGAETSKLLSQTVNFYGMREDALPALDADLFARYVEGLRASGWAGDTEAVRFGHAAASAARLVVRASTAIALASNDRARAGFERASGMPFETLAAKFRATLPYYLSLADEAGRLAGVV